MRRDYDPEYELNLPPRRSLKIPGVLITVLIAVACVAALWTFGNYMAPPDHAKSRWPSYHPNEICDDAFQTEQHFEYSKSNHIEIELKDTCWSGFVYVPLWWVFQGRTFHTQATGDLKNWWVAFWFADYPKRGPYVPGNNPEWAARVVRLQGHGKIILYTNQPENPNAKRY